MPATPHIEHHFTAGETVRDVVIGMSDGLTVPFALAAGLTGAINSSGIVVTAGFAEIAAGSVAMGLGGFLAARSDAQHYASEHRREETEIIEKSEAEKAEVSDILMQYGLTQEEADPVVRALSTRPKQWVEFMMRFELGLERPEPSRAMWSALTIALAYVVGGLVPLVPYLIIQEASSALPWSAFFTLLALFVFGFVKAHFTGTRPVRGALQTMLIGGIAASVAFAIAQAVGS
jgi:VIT1/CCC1 family predicted Fe2+/Mn2+ transporter